MSDNKTPVTLDQEGFTSVVRDHYPPRVFVSYRWGDDDDWVRRFVADLGDAGVEVVFDKVLRTTHPDVESSQFIAKLINSMSACHAFVPVFTRGYLERIGYSDGKLVNYQANDGFVFDEFQKSLLLGSRRELETIGVVRSVDHEDLPVPFVASNTLDMRTNTDYAPSLRRLVEYLFLHRSIKTKKQMPLDPFV